MALEVRNLSFAYYGDKKVLDGINYTINDGEFACVLGPNGVGKSTMFKCILRLLSTYTGEIFVDGCDTKGLSPMQMAKKIAYIPQSAGAVFNYSVSDTILMGTTAMVDRFKSPGKKEEEYVDMALETLQITHLKNRMFTRISGGERQLVLIARALAQQAKTLLMDEPTASLDYGNQMRVMEKIKGLSEKGYTIIQSTHNPEQTLWYADRVLALQKGQLISEGAPSEVMDTDLLKQLYQVDVQIEALHEGRIHVCLPQKLLGSGLTV